MSPGTKCYAPGQALQSPWKYTNNETQHADENNIGGNSVHNGDAEKRVLEKKSGVIPLMHSMAYKMNKTAWRCNLEATKASDFLTVFWNLLLKLLEWGMFTGIFGLMNIHGVAHF